MRLLGGPHSVPHLGRAWPENGDGLRLAAESGRTGMDSTHGHSAVRRSTTARRRQGRALSCDWHPATTQVGNKAMRAAACDPMPNVVCGAPRSHLLWPLLAVKRLVGRSHDPPMACAIARIRGSCTSPGHAGGGGGCSASNKRTRSSARAALGEVAGSRLGRLQAACCGRALGATSGVLAELRGAK